MGDEIGAPGLGIVGADDRRTPRLFRESGLDTRQSVGWNQHIGVDEQQNAPAGRARPHIPGHRRAAPRPAGNHRKSRALRNRHRTVRRSIVDHDTLQRRGIHPAHALQTRGQVRRRIVDGHDNRNAWRHWTWTELFTIARQARAGQANSGAVISLSPEMTLHDPERGYVPGPRGSILIDCSG